MLRTLLNSKVPEIIGYLGLLGVFFPIVLMIAFVVDAHFPTFLIVIIVSSAICGAIDIIRNCLEMRKTGVDSEKN